MRYAPYIIISLAGFALAVAGILSLGIGAVYGGTMITILGAGLPYALHQKREQSRTH
jgi:hypothetical protein